MNSYFITHVDNVKHNCVVCGIEMTEQDKLFVVRKQFAQSWCIECYMSKIDSALKELNATEKHFK